MRTEQKIRKEYERYLKVRKESNGNPYDKGYVEALEFALGEVA